MSLHLINQNQRSKATNLKCNHQDELQNKLIKQNPKHTHTKPQLKKLQYFSKIQYRMLQTAHIHKKISISTSPKSTLLVSTENTDKNLN